MHMGLTRWKVASGGDEESIYSLLRAMRRQGNKKKIEMNRENQNVEVQKAVNVVKCYYVLTSRIINRIQVCNTHVSHKRSAKLKINWLQAPKRQTETKPKKIQSSIRKFSERRKRNENYEKLFINVKQQQHTLA